MQRISISCFHENPSITRPLTLPHICNKIHRQNSCAQIGKKTDQNIEIVVDGKVEVVGNMVEVPGRPPESNRACEHGPESKEQITANAQNLYRPLPKTLASELSFFAFVVGAVVGRESPSFIAFNLLDHTEFPYSDSDNIFMYLR